MLYEVITENLEVEVSQNDDNRISWLLDRLKGEVQAVAWQFSYNFV